MQEAVSEQLQLKRLVLTVPKELRRDVESLPSVQYSKGVTASYAEVEGQNVEDHFPSLIHGWKDPKNQANDESGSDAVWVSSNDIPTDSELIRQVQPTITNFVGN